MLTEPLHSTEAHYYLQQPWKPRKWGCKAAATTSAMVLASCGQRTWAANTDGARRSVRRKRAIIIIITCAPGQTHSAVVADSVMKNTSSSLSFEPRDHVSTCFDCNAGDDDNVRFPSSSKTEKDESKRFSHSSGQDLGICVHLCVDASCACKILFLFPTLNLVGSNCPSSLCAVDMQKAKFVSTLHSGGPCQESPCCAYLWLTVPE